MAITLEIVSGILQHYQNQFGLYPVTGKNPPVHEADIAVRASNLMPHILERGYVDEINIFNTEFRGQYIVAQVQVIQNVLVQPYNYQTVANIYLSDGQNLCWRRFAVCKEMFHCMIDPLESTRVTNLDQLKELLFLLTSDTTPLTGESQQLNSERLAELYALETLLPVEFRLHHLDDYRNGNLSAHDIACMYRVPEVYVELAFQEQYLRQARRLRGRLLKI